MTDMMLRIEVLYNNKEANKPWDLKVLWIHLARQGELTGDHNELEDGRKSVMWVSYLDFLFPRNQGEEIFFSKRKKYVVIPKLSLSLWASKNSYSL